MKKSQLVFIAICVFSIGILLSSCESKGDNKNSTENTETTDQGQVADKQGKEYTSAYICPMYCEGSGSDQPGACPACGMDYVMNENQHDHDAHEGHDHEH